MSERNDDQLVLARRDFLKTTGVVIVAFSIGGKVRAQTQAGGSPPRSAASFRALPTATTVDSYIAIHADNTATLYAGYVELGQGGPTALLQIAAEELDLDFDADEDRDRWTRTCRRKA